MKKDGKLRNIEHFAEEAVSKVNDAAGRYMGEEKLRINVKVTNKPEGKDKIQKLCIDGHQYLIYKQSIVQSFENDGFNALPITCVETN